MIKVNKHLFQKRFKLFFDGSGRSIFNIKFRSFTSPACSGRSSRCSLCWWRGYGIQIQQETIKSTKTKKQNQKVKSGLLTEALVSNTELPSWRIANISVFQSDSHLLAALAAEGAGAVGVIDGGGGLAGGPGRAGGPPWPAGGAGLGGGAEAAAAAAAAGVLLLAVASGCRGSEQGQQRGLSGLTWLHSFIRTPCEAFFIPSHGEPTTASSLSQHVTDEYFILMFFWESIKTSRIKKIWHREQNHV